MGEGGGVRAICVLLNGRLEGLLCTPLFCLPGSAGTH